MKNNKVQHSLIQNQSERCIQYIKRKLTYDYVQQLSNQELQQIELFYRNIYFTQQSNQHQMYLHLKSKITINKIIKSIQFIQKIGHTFSGVIIGSSRANYNEQQYQKIKSLKLCPNTLYQNRIFLIQQFYKVKDISLIDQETIQDEYKQTIDSINNQHNQIVTNNQSYYIKNQKTYYRLLKKNKNKTFYQQTGWIIQLTNDGRFIFKFQFKADVLDIKSALKFILMKKNHQKDAPSVCINLGTHGEILNQNSYNGYSKGNFKLLDYSIKYEILMMIQELFQQIQNLKLQSFINRKNISCKLHINTVSLQIPSIYPIQSNYIIDAQCFGAYQMIKAKDLVPKFSSIVARNIYFLSPTKKPLQILWKSQILSNTQQQVTLKCFFQSIGVQIAKTRLLFRASKSCGQQINTMFLCKTHRNKIIGAYSPLAHSWENLSLKPQQKYKHIKDESNCSFLFSLTNKELFPQIKDNNITIKRVHDNKQIIFGAQELMICDLSNINRNCKISLSNSNYMTVKYNKLVRQSYIQLTGSQDQLFTLKQWQVWKIQ